MASFEIHDHFGKALVGVETFPDWFFPKRFS